MPLCGQVRRVMGSTDRPRWIAGGQAIDLFVGTSTRAHADVDVLLLRRDQSDVHEVLAGR